MIKKLKTDYDYKNDTLYLYSNEKYKNSIEYFGILVDITTKDDIKGIEIPNASKFFTELLEKNISKNDLMNITNSYLETRKTKEMNFINFRVESDNISEINLPLSVPIS